MNASSQNDLADRTYRLDCLRAPFYGILEAGWQTFALVVAIRYFEAPENIKAFIAGSGPMGFLLTPITLYLAAHFALRPSKASSLMYGLAAILLLGAMVSPTLLAFSFFVISSQMAAVQQGTLMLQVYSENYKTGERGERLTIPLILTSVSTIAFAFAGGLLLDLNLNFYQLIFAIMTGSAIACAVFCFRIPSKKLSTKNVGNPWQNLSLVWKDKLFGYLLSTWMLLGLGNLITLPIRVEYLANPIYGIDADNLTIGILMVMVPAAARILSTRFWAHCFDKFHFITTRNLLNLFFLLSIALFFFSKNLVLLVAAMACQGVAMGGGKIFWSLWVTKIAPDEKASSYMSIHMALTGLRGTLAPFIGYYILQKSAPQWVALSGLILITLAIILFELVRANTRLRQIA